MQRSDALKVINKAGFTEDEALSLMAEVLEQTRPVNSPKPSRNSATAEEDALLTRLGLPMPTDPDRVMFENALAVRATDKKLADDALTVKRVSEMLQKSERRIRQRINERSLVSILDDQGHYLLPRFQFTDSGSCLPGLKAILQALSTEVKAMGIAEFFLIPAEELNEVTPVSPRDWLMQGGDIEPVVTLALKWGVNG